jgi:hypothetical protein
MLPFYGQTESRTLTVLEAVGQKVAKDFEEHGVFLGSVIGVEYDSEDNAKEKPFYVVQYTDGDKEDLNEEEYSYAHELRFQIDLDMEDERDANSASDEQDSYRPSSKVQEPCYTKPLKLIFGQSSCSLPSFHFDREWKRKRSTTSMGAHHVMKVMMPC